MRLLLLAFVCTLTSFDALAQEPAQAMKPGDILPITLSGDFALEYGMLDRTIRENENPLALKSLSSRSLSELKRTKFSYVTNQFKRRTAKKIG